MRLYAPDEKLHKKSRDLWDEALFRIGADERVFALSADLSRSVCTERFRKAYPERFINSGIAEQDMVGIAAGLALEGKIVYVSSFAPFVTMRAIEQFRTDICYMNLPVRMVGRLGGIAETGPTHSGLEDAGIVRGIANAAVVAVSDVTMIDKVFEASLNYDGPMYLRMGEGGTEPEIYAEEYDFTIGKAIEAKPVGDVAIISFGNVLKDAVRAAGILEAEGINAGIIDMHTLKPIDKDAVLAAAEKCGRIITLEDHSIINGLGSAVAEVLMDAGVPCKFKRLGIPDLYPCYGPAGVLHAKYGYDAESVAAAAREMLR